MNRTVVQSFLLFATIAIGVSMIEMPRQISGLKKADRILASRYPLRSRTPSFFERSKASYNPSKKVGTYQVK